MCVVKLHAYFQDGMSLTITLLLSGIQFLMIINFIFTQDVEFDLYALYDPIGFLE